MSNLDEIRVKNVTFNIGGKERHLKYTLNAFANLEDAYGSVEAAMDALQKGSIKAIRKMLWAGLIHEDPTLTEEEVGNSIELYQLAEIVNKLTEAIHVAMPKQENNIKPNPNIPTQK